MSTIKQTLGNGAFTVSALVTGLIAAWFLVAAGAIAAGTAPERFSAAPQAPAVAAAPDYRMTLTVVARREAPAVRTASTRVAATI